MCLVELLCRSKCFVKRSNFRFQIIYMESQHGNDERMQRAKQELFINPFSSHFVC